MEKVALSVRQSLTALEAAKPLESVNRRKRLGIKKVRSRGAPQMNKEDRKQLKRNYQQNTVPMGVFLIRNLTNDKVFVASGRNLQGIINRHRFQLIAGSHRNGGLQLDWSHLGSQNFAFEILEEFIPPDDTQVDEAKELAFMEKLWLEKLQPFGERGYNERQLSREEKLRRIAANRLNEP